MKKILPFFLLVLLLASCQKDPDMSKLSDDFVVFTDHNKDANFESFTTFYIPDSVMVIGSSEKPEFWSATEADDIVSTLVSGMEGRGYTRASDKESADLGLQSGSDKVNIELSTRAIEQAFVQSPYLKK